jgi:extracellular elastinolytic metalloproteinase
MRCFLTASLVIASLAGHIYGLRQPTPSPHDEGRVNYRRKTLGFGPEHPHAVFRASPYHIQTHGFTPHDPLTDPLDVARIFVDDVLSTQSSHGLSYKIRKDSYTDKNTGVTHVYVRQLVNGLEVTDGDMNINIKHGVVLSYGTSVCWQPFRLLRLVRLGTKNDIFRYC